MSLSLLITFTSSCGGGSSDSITADSSQGDEDAASEIALVDEPSSVSGTVSSQAGISVSDLKVSVSGQAPVSMETGGFEFDNKYQSNQLRVVNGAGQLVYRALFEDQPVTVGAESTAFYYAYFSDHLLSQLGPKHRGLIRSTLAEIPEYQSFIAAIENDISANGYHSFENVKTSYAAFVNALATISSSTANASAYKYSISKVRDAGFSQYAYAPSDYRYGLAILEGDTRKADDGSYEVDIEARSIYPLPLALWSAKTERDSSGNYQDSIKEKIPPVRMLAAKNVSNFMDAITSPIDTYKKYVDFTYSLVEYWKTQEGSVRDITDAVTRITLRDISCNRNALIIERDSVEAKIYLLMTDIVKGMNVFPGILSAIDSHQPLNLNNEKYLSELSLAITESLFENEAFTGFISEAQVSGDTDEVKAFLLSTDFLTEVLLPAISNSAYKLAKQYGAPDQGSASLKLGIETAVFIAYLETAGWGDESISEAVRETLARTGEGVDFLFNSAFEIAKDLNPVGFAIDGAVVGLDWFLSFKFSDDEYPSHSRLLESFTANYCSDLKADLQLTKIEMPSDVNIDEGFLVKAYVKNIGQLDIAGDIQVDFNLSSYTYLDGNSKFLERCPINGVKADQEKTCSVWVELDSETAEGSYHVSAHVNKYEVISESGFSNNLLYTRVRVSEPEGTDPDFSITGITINDGSSVHLGVNKIGIKVSNLGGGFDIDPGSDTGGWKKVTPRMRGYYNNEENSSFSITGGASCDRDPYNSGEYNIVDHNYNAYSFPSGSSQTCETTFRIPSDARTGRYRITAYPYNYYVSDGNRDNDEMTVYVDVVGGDIAEPEAITLPTQGPVLVSPVNIDITGVPAYSWKPVANATAYKIEVWHAGSNYYRVDSHTRTISAADAGCSNGTSNCSWSGGSALESGEYTWWVRGTNDAGDGPATQGSTIYFTVIDGESTDSSLAAYCSSYSSTAVDQQTQNLTTGCGFTEDIWHDDNDGHYSWCMSVDKSESQSHENSRTSALEKCSYCRSYATTAVSQQSQNLSMGCGLNGDIWHSNYQSHYNWCMTVDTGSSSSDERSRSSALTSCQSTNSFSCESYASAAVSQQNENISFGCGFTEDRWHSDYNGHLTWCEGVGQSVAESEAAIRQSDLASCR